MPIFDTRWYPVLWQIAKISELKKHQHKVWSRLFLYNFCSRLTSLAVVEQKDTKHIYQVNYTMAIKNCHDFLRQKQFDPPIDIVGLVEKYTLPIRPDRNFARQHRFQVPMKFTYRH